MVLSKATRILLVLGMLIFGLWVSILGVWRGRPSASVLTFRDVVTEVSNLKGREGNRESLSLGRAQVHSPRADLDPLVQLPVEGRRVGVSYLLHLLLYFGTNSELKFDRFSSSEQILELLLDSNKSNDYFGVPALVQTIHGAQFRTFEPRMTQNETTLESHRDQTLAVMGKLGVPLSQPIFVGDKEMKLEDCLRDSIATFTIDQMELTWSLESYLHYMHGIGQRSWHNKAMQPISFDLIVKELISRDIKAASCGGMHVVGSLLLTMEMDKRHGILSSSVRMEVKEWLSENLRHLSRKMLPNGSWDTQWQADSDRPAVLVDDWRNKLIVTSHVAEMFRKKVELFEDDFVLHPRVMIFLKDTVSGLSDEDRREFICPVTHAIIALRDFNE